VNYLIINGGFVTNTADVVTTAIDCSVINNTS